ncbi:MAG: PAS sensor protein [Bacteroidetes bacterium]|nr:PAS sensor protein [Bacteroidota bacterium]
MFDWAHELSCAVTVCNAEGVVLYQNQKSKATFADDGDFTGKNLKDCHTLKSWNSILRLMQDGEPNTYTIEKNGVKKLIHQTPWYKEGLIAGLVELSIVLPAELPHYIR